MPVILTGVQAHTGQGLCRDLHTYSTQSRGSAQRSPEEDMGTGGGGDPLTAAQQTLDLTVQATRRSHSETQYLDHTLAAFHCVCHPQQHPVSQKGSIDGHQPQVCVGVSLEDKHQAQG